MVHSQHFVVSVQVNGKFLREIKNNEGDYEVFLPFGCEYSLYFKNLESRRTVADVFIDGKEAIKGLVIDKSTSTILERFFEGNAGSGHKFKFIEKTKEISDYRGDLPEDGLIVIKYRFEKQVERHEVIHVHKHKHVYDPWWDYNPYYPPVRPNPWKITYRSAGTGNNDGFDNQQVFMSHNVANVSGQISHNVNVEGITVEGNTSYQNFNYTTIGELEETEHTIVIKLKGEVAGQNNQMQLVAQPVVTREKIQCNYCGKKNENHHKFCSQCGAAVMIK